MPKGRLPPEETRIFYSEYIVSYRMIENGCELLATAVIGGEQETIRAKAEIRSRQTVSGMPQGTAPTGRVEVDADSEASTHSSGLTWKGSRSPPARSARHSHGQLVGRAHNQLLSNTKQSQREQRLRNLEQRSKEVGI